MNKRPAVVWLGGVILVMVLLISACRPEIPTPPPSEISGGVTATAEAGGEEAEPGTGGEQTGGEAEIEESGFAKVADDIPVPQGAYEDKISSDGLQIIFKVAGDPEGVVAYYQENLPASGWEMAGPQDTAVGNSALMLRAKPNGDRISINLQYNPNGQFTVVTMVVTRAD